jgi:hypothetical protein
MDPDAFILEFYPRSGLYLFLEGFSEKNFRAFIGLCGIIVNKEGFYKGGFFG